MHEGCPNKTSDTLCPQGQNVLKRNILWKNIPGTIRSLGTNHPQGGKILRDKTFLGHNVTETKHPQEQNVLKDKTS
jgi:hypothetical protein